LAVTGAGPGQLLSWLNIVAHHLTGAVTATAVCGLYDPDARTLRWARAGHLPPVLVRGDGAAPLPTVRGMLLGAVAEARYEEAEVTLAAQDTLLMYTDGLIERRDRTMEEALTQLLTTVGTAPRSLDQQLDRMLTHSRSDTHDDTCIVGIRVGWHGRGGSRAGPSRPMPTAWACKRDQRVRAAARCDSAGGRGSADGRRRRGSGPGDRDTSLQVVAVESLITPPSGGRAYRVAPGVTPAPDVRTCWRYSCPLPRTPCPSR